MLSQHDLEARSIDRGIASVAKAYNRARQKGWEVETPIARRYITGTLEALAQAITAKLDAGAPKGPGRGYSAIPLIRDKDPYVMAYLTLRAIAGCAMRGGQRYSVVCPWIARAIEHETRYARFAEEYPDAYQACVNKIKKEERERDRTYQHTLFSLWSNRYGVPGTEWSVDDQHRIGSFLLELVISELALVEIVTRREKGTKGKTVKWVIPTERTASWFEEAKEHEQMAAQVWFPMVEPPRDWHDLWSGGYYTTPRSYPLVKRNPGPNGRAFYRLFQQRARRGQMDQVFEAVNILQRSPWAINAWVLATMREALERRVQVGNLPLAEPPPPPARSQDLIEGFDKIKAWRANGEHEAARQWREDHAEELAEYRRQRKAWHDAVHAQKVRYIQALGKINLALEFVDQPSLYFPYFLDSRGRAYPKPAWLSPQGDDIARSLLRARDGKPITDENEGFFWLCVYGANLYGVDKCNFEERQAWVLDHQDQIIALADAPFGNVEFWREADEPWTFLAFAFEFAAAIREGQGFVSTLPIFNDGTCNGLQHYAAMLRDRRSGEAVNLVPGEAPSDIYGEVAQLVLDRLRRVADGDEPWPAKWETAAKAKHIPWGAQEMAQKWLDVGIGRKLVKRSVMTLPYNATQFASRGFLEDALRESTEALGANPFGHWRQMESGFRKYDPGTFAATLWLQPAVWDAIGETVESAMVAQDYIKECVSKAVKRLGASPTWTAPDGFLASQDYPKSTKKRVRTVLFGDVIRPSVGELRDDIPDPRKNVSAAPPNFVHSLDATAMREFVRLAYQNGIEFFAVIHDSFGALAADVKVMRACIQESFAAMYEEVDPLLSLREDLIAQGVPERDLPPVPPKGDLDVNEVRYSEYFFS